MRNWVPALILLVLAILAVPTLGSYGLSILAVAFVAGGTMAVGRAA
jgi:hypothetical protein